MVAIVELLGGGLLIAIPRELWGWMLDKVEIFHRPSLVPKKELCNKYMVLISGNKKRKKKSCSVIFNQII